MRVVLCLCALVIVVASCDTCGEPLGDIRGAASGQVCNPLSGQPVGAGVTVTAVGGELGALVQREGVTDDNGFVTVTALALGENTLTVSSDAFVSRFTVDVTAQAGGVAFVDSACRDTPADPGHGTIVGIICNEHVGGVVTDAEIVVVLADGTVLSTRTDPETGEFSLEVPEGTVDVHIVGTYSKNYRVDVEDQGVTVVEQSASCQVPDPLASGFIVGALCRPGTLDEPLEGATVTVTFNGSGGQAIAVEPQTTDADGRFRFDPIAPTVATNIVVQARFEDFEFTWNVDRVVSRFDNPEGTQLVADAACQPLLPDDGVNYLVVTGQNDRIENVLDRMGLRYALHNGIPLDPGQGWVEQVFQTFDLVNQYDVIFVNCGASEVEFARALSPNAKRNLVRYVEGGGSLYVSDWAYELIEQVFPDKIDFLGDDEIIDAAQLGIGGVYNTRVVDADVAADIGDVFDIDYAFEFGAIIEDVADDVDVYLRSDMRYRRDVGGVPIETELSDMPVTVGFRVGAGSIIYTTFHQEGEENLVGPEDDMLQFLVLSL